MEDVEKKNIKKLNLIIYDKKQNIISLNFNALLHNFTLSVVDMLNPASKSNLYNLRDLVYKFLHWRFTT